MKTGIVLPFTRSPEQMLDREIRARVAAIRGADGKVPSRACYAIAEDQAHPARIIARRVREMKRKRVPREQVMAALVEPIAEFIDRLYGQGPRAA